MYKIAGIALMGIFAMMVIPSSIQTSEDGSLAFYGMADMTKYDAEGDAIFSQQVHNRLTNQGESFMLMNSFHNGTITSNEAGLIAVICVSDGGGSAITASETQTALLFDATNTITETNCKHVTAASINDSTSVATIGAITFNAGGTNLANGDTIRGIGVCQGATGNDDDFNDCATTGLLFAEVATSDTTLNSGETVDITYTFDLSSASN